MLNLVNPFRARQPVPFRRTLCLDFDGVVHSYTSGWKGARVISDPPVPGAIEFIYRVLNDGAPGPYGWDVVIHSSRSHHWGGRRAMRGWLKEWALSLWFETPSTRGLEDVRFSLFKPSAFVTIDDRALTFTGTWPDLQTLREFKPWNKR